MLRIGYLPCKIGYPPCKAVCGRNQMNQDERSGKAGGITGRVTESAWEVIGDERLQPRADVT